MAHRTGKRNPVFLMNESDHSSGVLRRGHKARDVRQNHTTHPPRTERGRSPGMVWK